MAPLIAWLCLAFIWGSSFIFMKWAALYITPFQVAFVRTTIGILPVALLALAARRLSLTHLKYSRHFLVMACLAGAFFYYGLARGTSLLHSGIAGALSGTIPLFSFAAAAILLPDERFGAKGILGLLAGLGGVLLITRPFESGFDVVSREGILVMAVTCLSFGLSFVYARRYITPLGLPPVALTTYQLGFAALILAAITPFDGIGNVAADTPAAIGLVVGLGLVGTGGAYVLFYYIIDRLGAVGASSVTYLSPAVALLIGLVFVGEPIRITDVAGASMILCGVLLISMARRSSPT